MPGEASLQAGQYYAHPRNHFWPILGALFGFDPAMPYARRMRALGEARVAVWDVLQSCERPGSLDSRIVRDSIEPNDFAALFARCRGIRRVCFNGAMAEESFRRHVLPTLDARALEFVRLPSTSPANASVSYARKLDAWRRGLRLDENSTSLDNKINRIHRP